MANYARGRNALRVGLLTAAAALAFLALFGWLTDRGFTRHSADLYVKLPTAERLRRGDPVIFRGVEVGKVRSVDFGTDGGVVVRTRLTRNTPLSRDATASLMALDVLGGQSLVLHEGSVRAPRLHNGDTLAGSVPPSLATRAEMLGSQAERLVGDTTLILVRGTLAGATEAAIELQRLISEARTLLAAQAGSLTRASAEVAELASNLKAATSGEPLARAVTNLEETTANLAAMTGNLNAASAALSNVLHKVDSGGGTAAQLLNDPGIYERVYAALTSLEALLRDLRDNPKRYVNISLF